MVYFIIKFVVLFRPFEMADMAQALYLLHNLLSILNCETNVQMGFQMNKFKSNSFTFDMAFQNTRSVEALRCFPIQKF